MRGIAVFGIALLSGAVAHSSQPPALTGAGWEARPRGGDGIQLRIQNVLLSRGSWTQFAAPDWSAGYYSSQATPPTPRLEGDMLTLTHAVPPELGALTETLRKLAPDTLEWTLQAEWRSEKPAIVEWCIGLWNAEYLLGASLSGEGELATSRLERAPRTREAETLFAGKQFILQARLATLEVAGERLSVLDGRGSARWWSRETPTLWLGVLRRALQQGERVELRMRLRLQPNPLPAQGAPLNLEAQPVAIPDRWTPTPREPELIPPPKIIWRETGAPFQMPADSAIPVLIEDDSYRPAADALARELSRYGIRATIRTGTPAPNGIFIGGSPDLQRQRPVPDQQGAYYLEARADGIQIVGRLPEGAFYGVQTLIQLLQPTVGALQVDPVRIIDYPHLKWRGVHLFGSTQPDFLPRLIENVIAHAKFNHLIIECGYGQWETIRNAWVDISAPKSLLREAVQVSRKNLLEPIPLIQSLGHMYWMFRNDANKHLAEDPDTPWAIAPRSPDTRPFLQRLYDEVFEVFQPRHFHVGLDEVTLRGRFPNRPESKSATVAELFTEHAEWLHSELKRRGVEKILMWGDVLLAPGEANDGGAHAKSPQEALYARERLSKLKDLVICDWHYTPTEPEKYISVPTLQNAGFSEIIATTWYNPQNIATFAKAARQRRIAGLLQSTWAGYSLSERTLQGIELRQFVAYLIAAAYAWDTDLPLPDALPYDFERLFIERYRREPVPLQAQAGFVIDLASAHNFDLKTLSEAFAALPAGEARLCGHRFQLGGALGLMFASYLAPESLPQAAQLTLNRPVRTLYLLHTTGWQTEVGKEVGRIVIEYADGTQVEQPVIYGWHLRAWNDPLYALEGEPLWRARDAQGNRATLRLLRWRNPSPEKTVRTIRFVATDPVVGWTLLGVAGE
ncbi:MAG: beta-N-acetylhexosaminidase [Fimbriimonadales bacterium]|nr:beta-N-acetylhexosaminidase [Fimbriimonadales bacterium]